jgi:hypothetical protein
VINMPALDTTPEAAAVQEEAYRNLGAMGRLRIAFDLSNLVRTLSEAGIQKRNPGYTAEQSKEALSRQLYAVHAGQREN